MANVPGTFYTAETQRRGTTPVSPPNAVDDPIDPVNPSGPPVVPPVAERYASEAAMIADQLNQKSGYLYFDGTDTWWYLGTTTGTIADYEAFGGGGVQSVTGDGVDNTDPDNPVLSFPTTAEIGAQEELDSDIVAALDGANVPSGSNVFATMADVGGGGADTNAVHYNAADGKNETEQAQARANIGVENGTLTVKSSVETAPYLWARPTNNILSQVPGIFESWMRGLVRGYHGEKVTISADHTNPTYGITIFHEHPSVSDEDRIITPDGLSLRILTGEVLQLTYNIYIQRWYIHSLHTYFPSYLKRSLSVVIPSSFNLEGVLIQHQGNSFATERFGVYSNTTTKLISAKQSGVEFGVQTKHDLGLSSTGRSIITAGGLFSGDGVLTVKNTIASSSLISSIAVRDSTDALVCVIERTGVISHPRSIGSNYSVRRDEQRLYYLTSVTTAGAINDQALTSGSFNYRFTAGTSLTGIAATDIGTKMILQNDNTVNLDLPHQDTGSVAANRFNWISGATLTIPTKGKIEIIYCTGSRWELVSKNF